MKDWDADLYRSHTGFVSELGAGVVELLVPRPGERILDIGCGDGALTEKLIQAGCRVVAIDASPDMVDAARQRGVEARVMDALELESAGWDGTFDAVFSNAALHWIHPMAAVVRGVYRVLKPGGRFAAELGGEGNCGNIRAALHEALRRRGLDPEAIDPWRFPSAREYTELLRAQGFDVTRMEQFDRPTELPSGVGRWLESVARPCVKAVPPDDQAGLIAEVEAGLAPVLRGADGAWRADYVRLRVRAEKHAAA